jgi:hypothetical protein
MPTGKYRRSGRRHGGNEADALRTAVARYPKGGFRATVF